MLRTAMELMILLMVAVVVCLLLRFRTSKSEMAKGLGKILKHNRKSAESKAIPFLTMPVWRFALFMAISFGLYHLYWHYVNWQAVKTRDGSAISPFWRTVFTIFWIYPLFKRIIGEARKHKYSVGFSAGLLAGLYIAAYVVSIPLSLFLTYGQLFVASLVTLILFVLLTVPMQQAANAVQPVGRSTDNWPTLAEMTLLIVGISLFAINFSSLTKSPNMTILEDIRAQMNLMKRSIQLSADYASCSDNLKKRLPLIDTNDQAALDAYNADHDKCEAIKLELNRIVERSESRSGWGL